MQSGKLGNYYPISSCIHKLNPIIKLISFLILLFLIWFVEDIQIELFFLIFLFSHLLLSHVPLKLYWKPIFKMKYLFLGMFLLGLLCHYQIAQFLILVLRLVNLILLSSILLYTTKKRELIYAMEFLSTPLILLKIPVRSMIMMITLSLQFIPNLFIEMEKILKSLTCRGMDYHYASKQEKWEIIKATINPMFIYTFKKADIMSDVMELKGYEVEAKRTHYEFYRLKVFDYLYFLFSIVLFILVIIKEVL